MDIKTCPMRANGSFTVEESVDLETLKHEEWWVEAFGADECDDLTLARANAGASLRIALERFVSCDEFLCKRCGNVM